MARDAIRFWRNGQPIEVSGFHPRTTLLDYLRLQERRVGTKEGCAEGDCGACTVALGRVRDGHVSYEPVNACILLLGQVDGAEVVTVEDLASRDSASRDLAPRDLASQEGLHPVQAAMVEHHGSQCGFCTPGIVMSLFTLYHDGERPLTREAVNDALAGNLCRCTGYRPIVDAALQVCAAPANDSFSRAREATAQGLAAMRDGDDIVIPHGNGFFAAPATEASLADLYARHPEATLVAGSTDVGLWVTKGMAELEKIIWLGRVAGLDSIEETADALSLGASATHARAFASLARIDPDLGELMRRFGSAQVRASGTVGGNIANGSPIGDLAPALIALGSTLELRRGESTRVLPLDAFFIAYRKQDRLPGEFVRRITVPTLKDGEVFRAYKVSKRFDEDISAVMGAFRFTLEGRRIAQARIAFGGMAGIPKRALETEAALAGVSLDDPSGWGEAMGAVARDYQPLDDHRASAAYRMTVARNLVFKALSETASGETRATRIIVRREAMEAAE
ncbi:xanthine dehydrogenase small subunit [Microvirga sp. TS319]|uniref:xanthine dehydrogenase small subunit n=1 Tax=Microvirga sp. TS319 TaxID=3241165 RepID=UPI00351A203C